MSATYIATHNVHSSWITNPEFIVVTHCETGKRRGRLYVPAIYMHEHHERFCQWISQAHIEYDESDIKWYKDKSCRLYFTSTKSEYARCAKYYPKQQHWALGKAVA